jgi:uncharacterized membrane protein YagU involved in acid resistance
MAERRTIATDLIKGAIAGAVATMLMDRVTTLLYELESGEAKDRENQARQGKTAYGAAAEKAAALVNVELSEEQRSNAGTAMHWATGIAAGALYGVLRKRWPAVARARGLPFGTGFFLLVDELMNPVLGFTPGPRAFPWQAHARGFGGHLAFGLTSEMVLEGLDRVA